MEPSREVDGRKIEDENQPRVWDPADKKKTFLWAKIIMIRVPHAAAILQVLGLAKHLEHRYAPVHNGSGFTWISGVVWFVGIVAIQIITTIIIRKIRFFDDLRQSK